MKKRAGWKPKAGGVRPKVRSPSRASLLDEVQRLHRQLALPMGPELAALRRSRSELEQACQDYVDLLDVAPVGHVTLDQNGCICSLNLAAARLMGQERRRLLGHAFLPWLVQADQRRFLHHMNRLRHGQSRVTSEVSIAALGGPPVPVQVISQWVGGESKEGNRFSTALVDLRERRQTEAKLRESEQRLGFAMEVSRAGDWDLDLEDHTVRRSLLHDRIFGYQTLLPEWTYEMFLRHVLPEDRASVDAKFRQVAAARADWSIECRIRRADQEVRWILGAGRHLVDPTTGRRHIVGIVQDITERKQTEERLREAAALLEQRVAQRTAELHALNERLQQEVLQRRALEGRFLDINERQQRRIGQELHDNVCSQLTGIEYLAHALAQSLPPVSAPEARRARKIARLLQGAMADARKLAHGLTPLSLDARGLIGGLQELTAHTRKVYDRRCTFQGDSSLEVADAGKALHLYRIAQEAVTNAVRHGGAKNIAISLSADGNAVILKVSDNGYGLAAYPPRRRGVGLLTMQSRAAAMGGSLVVQPNQRGGTDVVCTVTCGVRRSQANSR